MTDEDLIKYGLEEDVWFHADKLSSAHIYLRMNEGETWETIPGDVLTDCAQLTKANSIEGVCETFYMLYLSHWVVRK
jgi:predicted ribosome quality control (RQC) complex YloA/Tae2 family protein